MASELTPAERRQVAAATGISADYLWQCLTGRRAMDAAEARRIETETFGKVKRWQVRQKDWHLIWPELVGVEGAPALPTADVKAA